MASRVLVALRVAASPARAFDVFVNQVGEWWRPNALFRFHRRGTGQLRFEPGEGGRLVELLSTGREFEIGRIRVWRPPERLVFGWRQAGFRPDQATEVHVTFEPAGDGTRITVEHFGWETVPAESAAKHGFPEAAFLRRHAEWWRALLVSVRTAV